MVKKPDAKTIAVGAGLAAAAAAAAAGAYWLYGAEDAARHRKQVRSWMLKARAEVMDAVEKLGDVDKATYLAIVEQILGRYSSMKGVTSAEIAQVARDLRSAWSHMESAHKTARGARRPAGAAKKRKTKAKKKATT